MAAGFPGAFQGALTTGNLIIGAAQNAGSGVGFPGAFQAALTTGQLNIGAVQKTTAVSSADTAAQFVWHTSMDFYRAGRA